eukprot:6471407-Amphidinium_carterae.1
MNHLDPLLPPEIFAYRPGWDMKEVMVHFQDELATRWECGQSSYGLALDASKAFPSLRRSALAYIARRVGVLEQLWRALEAHYEQGDT